MGINPHQTMFWSTVVLHHPGTTTMWLIYQHVVHSLSLVHVVAFLSLQGVLQLDASYNACFSFNF